MTLADVLAGWLPWSADHTETWAERARQYWDDQPRKMAELEWLMSRHGWVEGPAELGWDRLVWDGHHRIVVALRLGWQQRFIPTVLMAVADGR